MYFADTVDFLLKPANPFQMFNHCTASSLSFVFKNELFLLSMQLQKTCATLCISRSLVDSGLHKRPVIPHYAIFAPMTYGLQVFC